MVLSRVTKSKQPSCVWVNFGFDVCQLCEGPRPKSTPLESSHGLPELLSCLGGGAYTLWDLTQVNTLEQNGTLRKPWDFSSLPWYYISWLVLVLNTFSWLSRDLHC